MCCHHSLKTDVAQAIEPYRAISSHIEPYRAISSHQGKADQAMLHRHFDRNKIQSKLSRWLQMAPDGLRHAVLQSCRAHPRWHWGHGCREFEPLARLVRWFHGGWPSLARTVSREPSCRLNVALVCTCRLCAHLVCLYIVADCCTHPNSFLSDTTQFAICCWRLSFLTFRSKR